MIELSQPMSSVVDWFYAMAGSNTSCIFDGLLATDGFLLTAKMPRRQEIQMKILLGVLAVHQSCEWVT
jgi:ethanolamine transporter EutH